MFTNPRKTQLDDNIVDAEWVQIDPPLEPRRVRWVRNAQTWLEHRTREDDQMFAFVFIALAFGCGLMVSFYAAYLGIEMFYNSDGIKAAWYCTPVVCMSYLVSIIIKDVCKDRP